MSLLVNLVLGVAMVLAIAMFAVFTGDRVAARQVLAVSETPAQIAFAKRKVSLAHGAEASAVLFAVGVIISFILVN